MQVRRPSAPVPFPFNGHKINGEMERKPPSQLAGVSREGAYSSFSRVTVASKDSDLFKSHQYPRWCSTLTDKGGDVEGQGHRYCSDWKVNTRGIAIGNMNYG